MPDVTGHQDTIEAVRIGVVEQLRSRLSEIELSIFAHICAIVDDPTGTDDAEYKVGLRKTVTAVVEYGLVGIELGKQGRDSIPSVAVVQVHRAARLGVELETVLRRYIAGYKLFGEYVTRGVENLSVENGTVAHIVSVQVSLLEHLIVSIAGEYKYEIQRVASSREHRRAELARHLLAGRDMDASDLNYDFDGWHLGIIAKGIGAGQVVRRLAAERGWRLLALPYGDDTVWAWLGGFRRCTASDIERVLSGKWPASVSLAVGEPAKDVQGWRLTHRQAQAALRVALRRSDRFTKYVDVALLAAVLQDDVLARSLAEIYLSPLGLHKDAGTTRRRTLRAYLDAHQNASQAAVILKVTRQTVENRLRAIEDALGRPRQAWLTDLAIALRMEALGDGRSVPDPTVGVRTLDCLSD